MIPQHEKTHDLQQKEYQPEDDEEKISLSFEQDEKRANLNSQNHPLSKTNSSHSDYSSQQSLIQHSQQVSNQLNPNKFLIKFHKKPTKKDIANNKNSNHISDQLKEKFPIAIVYPWLSAKTLSIQNYLIKMHNEIIDYFLAFRQTEQIHNSLLFTFNQLQGLLFKTFNNCYVLAPFLNNQVYLKNSEVEVFILFDASKWKSPQTIQKVRQCLQKMKFQQIRFFEAQAQQGKQQKIGFNCLTPQKNYPFQIKLVTQEWISYISMMNEVLQNNLQAKYLYLIFDTMIRQRGLNNSIKGYFLLGLIAVFLHQRKRQRTRSLTQNLLKFLEYFGVGPLPMRRITYIGQNEFEITQDYQQNSTQFSPFSFWICPTIDVSTHMTRQFFSLLKNRYRLIGNYNFSTSQSMLWPLINPAQEEFRY